MADKAMRQLNNTEVSAFCSQVALMLQSGLPLSDGLHLMLEDSAEEESIILSSLAAAIDAGSPLTEALENSRVFPDYMIRMVEIGEETGRLDDVFKALARHYEREAALRESLRSSMTYPMIMICMVFIISGVLLAKVMPVFSQVFNQLGTELSGTGRILLGAGTIISRYSVVFIGIMMIAAALMFISYRKDHGQSLLKKLSRLRTGKKIQDCASTCRFADGMALALSSGLTPERCLELTRPLMTESESLAKLDKCMEIVSNGGDIYQAMVESGLLSGLYARLAVIGHRTGRMDQCMEEIARLSQKELDESIESVLSVIEPVLVIVISIVVGAILLSVMLPLIGIMSVI